jgi:hypothetical protein
MLMHRTGVLIGPLDSWLLSLGSVPREVSTLSTPILVTLLEFLHT